MADHKEQFDFPTLLASCVHDMKNSLGMMLVGIDEYIEGHVDMKSADFDNLSQLRYEARRVNNNLVELLALYKLDRDQYAFHIDEYVVTDFFEELAAEYHPILASKRIKLEIICDEELIWFFDRSLIASAIGNVLANTIRYARQRMCIEARESEGFLVITVEDDGEGFPEHFLMARTERRSGIDPQTGSTGLGLYFAELAAMQHTNGERTGKIQLSNDSRFGGGRFSILLP